MAVALLLTTAPNSRMGKRLAEGLVQNRLAACVTILKGALSVYRWGGKVEKTAEVQLLIKTTARKSAAVRRWIEEHHSYEVPEIISLRVSAGSARYLSWIKKSLR
ncbi:MAG: divalent-cation tolerance protein CutA [Candidatus Omnitrophica bacterium]|nr:divalent-cation tolerance protein CutA [Candidatus Omnitrophota bacterium]